MKKIFLVALISILFYNCKTEPLNYLTIKGEISNLKDSTQILISKTGYSKIIKVGTNGKFSDSLKSTGDLYQLSFGNNKAMVYLKNGYQLNLVADNNTFREKYSFSGNDSGAETNNYIKKRGTLVNDFASKFKSYYALNEGDFNAKLKEFEDTITGLLSGSKIDDDFKAKEQKSLDGFVNSIRKNYVTKNSVSKTIQKGMPSPKFLYENHKGGKTSLDDLKGNYVYIDVWATWCGPCKREIPHLKKLEKQFHGKNIKFVSISVDKKELYGKWKSFVAEQKLGGVQLYADNAFQSKFIQSYGINSIPRFILLDKQGNILETTAPRPSSGDTIENLLASLK